MFISRLINTSEIVSNLDYLGIITINSFPSLLVVVDGSPQLLIKLQPITKWRQTLGLTNRIFLRHPDFQYYLFL